MGKSISIPALRSLGLCLNPVSSIGPFSVKRQSPKRLTSCFPVPCAGELLKEEQVGNYSDLVIQFRRCSLDSMMRPRKVCKYKESLEYLEEAKTIREEQGADFFHSRRIGAGVHSFTLQLSKHRSCGVPRGLNAFCITVSIWVRVQIKPLGDRRF